MYRNRRVLISGGLGFIGSNRVIRLAALGAGVAIVDAPVRLRRQPAQQSAGLRSRARHPVEHRTAERAGCAAAEADVMFNLAGEVSHTQCMRFPKRDALLNAGAHRSFLLECSRITPGVVCDPSPLTQIARTSAISIVQDTCQVHGVRFENRGLPQFSSTVAYSFYPVKNLGCLGDGPAVITHSARLAAEMRMLRDGGRRRDRVSRMIPANSRLDEIQACFLRAFLPKLDELNLRRAMLAALYNAALSRCPAVRVVSRTRQSVNHLYVIRAPRRVARCRERLPRNIVLAALAVTPDGAALRVAECIRRFYDNHSRR